MRQTVNFFAVDGKGMLLPDGPVEVTYEDVLSPESGRDESGRYHRFVLQHKLRRWKFTYRHLTEEEKTYLENLFAQKQSFTFTHPADDRGETESHCCCEKFNMLWRSAKSGLWEDYTFRIAQL